MTDDPRTGVTVHAANQLPRTYPEATDFRVNDGVLRLSRGKFAIALFAHGQWKSMDYHLTEAEIAEVIAEEQA